MTFFLDTVYNLYASDYMTSRVSVAASTLYQRWSKCSIIKVGGRFFSPSGGQVGAILDLNYINCPFGLLTNTFTDCHKIAPYPIQQACSTPQTPSWIWGKAPARERKKKDKGEEEKGRVREGWGTCINGSTGEDVQEFLDILLGRSWHWSY